VAQLTTMRAVSKRRIEQASNDSGTMQHNCRLGLMQVAANFSAKAVPELLYPAHHVQSPATSYPEPSTQHVCPIHAHRAKAKDRLRCS
jgi:hypothetical protein